MDTLLASMNVRVSILPFCGTAWNLGSRLLKNDIFKIGETGGEAKKEQNSN